jgi:hypothetical protein
MVAADAVPTTHRVLIQSRDRNNFLDIVHS